MAEARKALASQEQQKRDRLEAERRAREAGLETPSGPPSASAEDSKQTQWSASEFGNAVKENKKKAEEALARAEAEKAGVKTADGPSSWKPEEFGNAVKENKKKAEAEAAKATTKVAPGGGDKGGGGKGKGKKNDPAAGNRV